MKDTHLEGLEGHNPLGLLAAIGVQVAFQDDVHQPRLWWTEGITPHAVVDEAYTLDCIVDRAMQAFVDWRTSHSVRPTRPDGSAVPKGDELKLKPDDIRAYLGTAATAGASELAPALVAEGSLDKQGVAKPSDLYFTAGQMKFLDMARKILAGVDAVELRRGLTGPWAYESTLPSLGWDVTDDRIYALRATNPSPEKKLTNPGPEALAILGMSRFPVFAGRDRTLTQGFSGKWKAGHYSWPLWRKPAGLYGVKSLLAHAYSNGTTSPSQDWYQSWSVFAVLRSPVRRSNQGGYGTFGPSEVVWRRW